MPVKHVRRQPNSCFEDPVTSVTPMDRLCMQRYWFQIFSVSCQSIAAYFFPDGAGSAGHYMFFPGHTVLGFSPLCRSTTITPRPSVCRDHAAVSGPSKLPVCPHSIATGLFHSLPNLGRCKNQQLCRSKTKHHIHNIFDFEFYIISYVI